MAEGARTSPSLLAAALHASTTHGLSLFPVRPGTKVPALERWEQRASRDPAQLRRWFAHTSSNIGVATGPSRLLVVDLDTGPGPAPAQWAGARDGCEVFARLAAAAGEAFPPDTYSVRTGSGGVHIYYRRPDGLQLRNTAGRLGWHVDTRASGGYVVGACSATAQGNYRVLQRRPIAPLPHWLVAALAPPTPEQVRAPAPLSPRSVPRYVSVVVADQTTKVAAAQPGTRHTTLLHAAVVLGQLVGGEHLDVEQARAHLAAAAAGHVGIAGCTQAEVDRTVDDGIRWGRQRPRQVRSAAPRC